MVAVFDHDPAAQRAARRAARGAEPLRRVPALPRTAAGYAIPPTSSSATSPSPTGSTTSSSTPSRGVYATPPSTGGSTRPARSSSTSRTTSSCGASATCRSSPAPSAIKTGTGGSSGVDFLRRALDLTFFPELYAVRTRIGASARPRIGAGDHARTPPGHCVAGVDPLGWAAVRLAGEVAGRGERAGDLRGCRGWASRNGAGAAAGPSRRRSERAGEARRLPARLPRRHGAPVDPAAARRAGAGRAVRELPQSRLDEVALPGRRAGRSVVVADFRRLRVRHPYVAMVPQWDLLEPARRQARGRSRPSRCGCAPR